MKNVLDLVNVAVHTNKGIRRRRGTERDTDKQILQQKYCDKRQEGLIIESSKPSPFLQPKTQG